MGRIDDGVKLSYSVHSQVGESKCSLGKILRSRASLTCYCSQITKLTVDFLDGFRRNIAYDRSQKAPICGHGNIYVYVFVDLYLIVLP